MKDAAKGCFPFRDHSPSGENPPEIYSYAHVMYFSAEKKSFKIDNFEIAWTSASTQQDSPPMMMASASAPVEIKKKRVKRKRGKQSLML